MGKREECSSCEYVGYLHRHHVVPKVLGGSDKASNIVSLCEDCHGLVHGLDKVSHRSLQMAGIEAAKVDDRKYLGRKPSYTQETLSLVNDLLSQGVGVSEISRIALLSRQTIIRIRFDPVAAEKVLERWY